MEREADELEILRTTPGRALLAEPDGAIHISRRLTLYRSEDDGRSWRRIGELPRSAPRRLAEGSRLACRLLRHQVRGLVRLSSGRYVAATKRGVFHGHEGDELFQPSRLEAGELRASPPMRMAVGPDDVVVWGEYVAPRAFRPVRILASGDGGESFQVVQALPPGEVVHIHSVQWDAREGHFWVMAGDHGEEPGIGRLSADLRRFDWFVKGEQRFRAVVVFDCGEHLVYATDTERERNAIVRLDKRTGRSERLAELEGSGIYGCRFGDVMAVTTTVEPSKVNSSRWSSLWISHDSESWRCVYRARKDRWHPDLFQFGSIVLPAGASDRDLLVASGQAIEGLDDRTMIARPPRPFAGSDGEPRDGRVHRETAASGSRGGV